METKNDYKRSPNPRKHANIFSILTFWWMIPIFRKGYKQNLEIGDLFETLDSQNSDKKGDLLESAWDVEKIRAERHDQDPSLTRVLIKVFGPSILWYGVRFAFVEICIKMMQPIALGHLVLYYSTNVQNESQFYAIVYSLIIIGCSVLSSLIYYPTLLATFQKSLKLKVACASLIYRKALRLKSPAIQQVTAGHVINLLSADLNTLDLVCFFCHNLWIGPLVTVIATTIMYKEIGPYALLGVFIILMTIPFQGWLSKVCASLKRKAAARTDERLEVMNEIIKGIYVIKVYAWENFFTKIVSIVRRTEVALLQHFLYIKGLHVAFTIFRTRTAIFSSILAYVVFGNILTAEKVFVVTACFNTMRHSMTDFFSFAIEQIALARISIKRIEKFLLLEQVPSSLEYKDVVHTNSLSESHEVKIRLKNVSAKWKEDNIDNVLNSISLEVNSGEFVALIGPVGSGKSSLFNVILQEMDTFHGTVDVNGSISYASQEPWLFTASVKENILFGQKLVEERYAEVIRICSLQPDFVNFPYGDQTLVGDRGASLSGGQKIRINLARALYKQADIYLLDDPFSALDSKVANEVFENCVGSFLKDKICILITHQPQYLKTADTIVFLNKGEITFKGKYENIESDIWNYTELNQKITDNEKKNDNAEKICDVNNVVNGNKTCGPKISEEKIASGRVTWNTYKAYFLSCGSTLRVIFVFSLFVLAQTFASTQDYFLKYWVNMEQLKHTNETLSPVTNSSWQYVRTYCIYAYTGITLTTILVTLASCFAFYHTSTRGSLSMHDSMFASILQANMRFFNTNPAGRILNRFSKDIETLDVTMPYALINCLQTVLCIFGVVIIVTIVNPWLIIPTVAIFFVLNILRTVYLTVSNNMKRLESTTRSPVLNYVTTSLHGLSTIRANKAQHMCQMEFDTTQDVHTTARFINVTGSRMFALWIEMTCAVYLTLVVFSFFIFGNEYGGNVGLAITQVMGLMGHIQWGIRQSSELENLMTSVERVIEYRDLDEKETSNTIVAVTPNWPQEGRIDFQNVSLFYGPEDLPVLQKISFTIQPRQKIGIIGRTGSGKSSIINAILQLSQTSGSIFIDDINVKNLDLHDLRSKISVILQEPVLFSGTIRSNLDPFEEFEDHELWKVLKDINFSDDELKDGLQSKIVNNGSNFSVGQKQLICLARAIIRNNKILILDEATANVDPETDNLIQQTIRTMFADCTVLTIAHRLENVIDSDKILTMEDGVVKEFDHPYLLVQNKESYLSKMLYETGEMVTLKFIATVTQNYTTSMHSST